MRKLCPNFDREDGLDTVLEVPIPEEMFGNSSPRGLNSWQNMRAWMRAHAPGGGEQRPLFGGRSTDLQLLLNVIGAPLIPLPVHSDPPPNHSIKDHPIEVSTAKYIVQQYIAATGGQAVLNSVHSMYAVGKVRMLASEFHTGDRVVKAAAAATNNSKGGNGNGILGEVGAFVLWQKNPDLWCLELVVSGCKISAGSDGKVAWRQTPWHQSHASRGPPRPLRRSLQGLDPRSAANLFSNAVCIGEKMINNEDCFILKLEVGAGTLKSRSSSSVEIMRHTVWGYFSQRTGLLCQFEDCHLLRIKANSGDESYWETSMESLIDDYRLIDGIAIAHSGRTVVSLLRYGETSTTHSRTRMEETWSIEEVDFNIWGLSGDCFLPPADLRKEQDSYDVVVGGGGGARGTTLGRSKSARIVAPENGARNHQDSTDEEDED